MTARTSIQRLADEAPVPSANSWPARMAPLIAKPIDCQRERMALVMDRIHAEVAAEARKTARTMIKDRAREYLAVPWQLDMIRGGFIASLMTPAQLIEFAKEVLRQDMTTRHRYELIPVQKLNAKAALVAARYLRAKAHRKTGMAT